MLRVIFNTFFWIISVLLITKFGLNLIYPGTADTETFFNAIKPIWPIYSGFTHLLAIPASGFLSLISSILPASKALLPSCHTAPVLTYAYSQLITPLLKQPAPDFQALYPGKVEWALLLTIPFWWVFFQCISLFSTVVRMFLPVLQSIVSLIASCFPQSMQQHTDQPEGNINSPAGSQSGVPSENGPTRAHLMLKAMKEETRQLTLRQVQMRQAFSKYMSPRVLEYIEKNQHVIETLNNKPYQLSIMFCDIRNFTQYTNTHTAQEVNLYLSKFYDIVNHVIINQFDGVINKLMGDAVMAYWGFPVPSEDHAYLCTRAGIEILKTIQRYNQQNPQEPLHVGVGICSGDVNVGHVGSKDFMDFTLVGDSVNLASRIQNQTKDRQTSILISESTKTMLRNQILCTVHPNIQIKGFTQTFNLYEPEIR